MTAANQRFRYTLDETKEEVEKVEGTVREESGSGSAYSQCAHILVARSQGSLMTVSIAQRLRAWYVHR